MTKISEDVEAVCATIGLACVRLQHDEALRRRKHIEKKYTKPQKRGWGLWERLDSDSSEYFSYWDRDSWLRISEFTRGRPVLLFFEEQEDDAMFLIESGELTNLLGEMYLFVPYVSDEDASFLICHNDHDFLIAMGGAAAWLKTTFEGASE